MLAVFCLAAILAMLFAKRPSFFPLKRERLFEKDYFLFFFAAAFFLVVFFTAFFFFVAILFHTPFYFYFLFLQADQPLNIFQIYFDLMQIKQFLDKNYFIYLNYTSIFFICNTKKLSTGEIWKNIFPNLTILNFKIIFKINR